LLLVLNINDPDMEFGMSATYAMLMIIFGSDIRKHTAFVFTHCDPETKKDWEPKKEKILKEWNTKVEMNSVDPKINFPIFFTSMKTQEGLQELKKAIEKMGRFETKQIKEWREILQDKSKTQEDFEEAITEKFSRCLFM
jgi:GTP-binding protein EngB required for normal cell division